MCGIAGFIDRTSSDRAALCRRMTDALIHRGPDDSGYFADDPNGVFLGHRRLSILDLSAAGHQPMASTSGRYVVVFNGEIYNHLGIRAELESAGLAHVWRGHSDTETLLAAIDAFGIVATLRRCVGMFALALFDRQALSLTLARDRAGEKPLYYGRQGNAFLFGSELKALQKHPAFRGSIDRGAIALFLRHNYVPDPYCIYEGIAKLSPGTLLTVAADGSHGEPVPYWSVDEAARGERRSADPAEALKGLEQVLGQAVADQMVADVPLGAFLSGGIDSSVIVALMQERSSRPIRSFTIGFSEQSYNEAGYARAVASHLGTDHTELIVTPAEAMDVIPSLPTVYDEPFADSSQIPTMLVAALARRHVTVALSGDAGDELFGGYNRYRWAERVWNGVRRVPYPLRRLGAGVLRGRSPDAWTRDFRRLAPLLPKRLRLANPGDNAHKLAEILALDGPGAIYRTLVSHEIVDGLIAGAGAEPVSRLQRLMAERSRGTFAEDMMYWDLLTYLPGDILTKVDRASMAVSLETRVPMLDHRVIEFAWSLPLALRVRDGVGKWLLRELLFAKVPRALFERPKMGFGVPIDAWLRGPLRAWAEDLLDPARMRAEGIFDPAPVWSRWEDHLSGRVNRAYWLWNVLMFQAWHRAQRG